MMSGALLMETAGPVGVGSIARKYSKLNFDFTMDDKKQTTESFIIWIDSMTE